MDARAYIAQALIAVVMVALTALSKLWWWGLALSVLHLAGWLLLDAQYARSLGSRARGLQRARADRVVARVAIASASAGAVVCITVPLTGPRLTSDIALAVGIAGAATIPTVMSISSLVDWYFVRARRDGVVCDPPCKRSEMTTREFWQQVTRMWYLHRSFTIVLVFVATILAVTAVTFGLIELQPTAQGAVLASVLAAALVVVQIIYDLRALSTATTQCALRPPDIVLGDMLASDAAQANGFVVDVAVEGISVIAEPGAISRSRTLVGLQRDNSIVLAPYTGCRFDNCSLIIPSCQLADAIQREPEPRLRRLIV